MSYSWFQSAPMVIGRGALEHLAQLSARRVAVIADLRAAESSGALERAGAYLRRAGSDWTLVHDARREPRVRDVEQSIGALRAYAPDALLAMGGGSALDAAKALWFFYELPDATWEQAFAPFAIPPLGARARLIAVPTTSGTGSETTCAAVLVDERNRKRLMLSREIVPSLAVLDPDLADSMPSPVAAASGMDALTHALEAAVCRAANPMVAAVAVEAAVSLRQWLPLSVAEASGSPLHSQARELVHYAASRAGMALNNSSAGLAHAMDQVGPRLGVPHGLACALALPATVEFLGPQPAFSRIALALGGSGGDAELWRHLLDQLRQLGRELGLPGGYRQCGISEQSYAALLPELIQEALDSGSTRLAPAVPDSASFERMFWQAFHGEEV
jgi:alcohol dehydrogenase class IV